MLFSTGLTLLQEEGLDIPWRRPYRRPIRKRTMERSEAANHIRLPRTENFYLGLAIPAALPCLCCL
ncbi:hypothetical protein GW17_00005542 [Ensete ventricosum]|nr:hypothetical protein GW17_00005542 [Ensete ventricosum]